MRSAVRLKQLVRSMPAREPELVPEFVNRTASDRTRPWAAFDTQAEQRGRLDSWAGLFEVVGIERILIVEWLVEQTVAGRLSERV